MKNVLVRDVPDDVHAELQRRAERRGKSLQQYVAGELKRIASRPSLDEVPDGIEAEHSGGRVGLAAAVGDLESARTLIVVDASSSPTSSATMAPMGLRPEPPRAARSSQRLTCSTSRCSRSSGSGG